jgi:hypothetical protein
MALSSARTRAGRAPPQHNWVAAREILAVGASGYVSTRRLHSVLKGRLPYTVAATARSGRGANNYTGTAWTFQPSAATSVAGPALSGRGADRVHRHWRC